MTGLLVTGTENSRRTDVPTSHSVTNTPAIPASLISRERPRIAPRCSTPRMVTWSGVSISYRSYRRWFIRGLGFSAQFIGLEVFFLPSRGHARTFAELFRKRNKALQTRTCAVYVDVFRKRNKPIFLDSAPL